MALFTRFKTGLDLSGDFQYHKSVNLEIAGFFFLCAVVFTLSFPLKVSLYINGSFLFISFLCWVANIRIYLPKLRQKLMLVLPSVAYFVINFISYFAGDHKWANIENKLYFLLIPLAGFPVFTSEILAKNIKFLFGSFILGLLTISSFELIRALCQSIQFDNNGLKFIPLIDNWIPRFFSYGLSYIEHPTYFSMKILWAIILLFSVDKIFKGADLLRYLLILFFAVFIYLLSSKAGLLILIIIILYIIYSGFGSKSHKVSLFLIPLFIVFSFYIAGKNYRVAEFYNAIKAKESLSKTELVQLDHRTKEWYSALQIISREPVFGVGVSNAVDEMEKELRRNGFTFEADLRYNTHNQFFETQLAMGIPGTMVLLWIILLPFFARKKIFDPVLINLFLLIVVLNFLFESMLVRQWGIIFFLVFYHILMLCPKRQAS